MSMDYCYKLNAGQYVLHDGDQPIGQVLDEVAIAINRASGTLHRHGDPQMVSKWLADTQGKLRRGGYHDMADDLVMISGRFELEDLNRCLNITGYAGRLYKRLVNGAPESRDQPAPQP